MKSPILPLNPVKPKVEIGHILSDLCWFVGQNLQGGGKHAEAERFYNHLYNLGNDDPILAEAMMYSLIAQRRFYEAIKPCTEAMKDDMPGKRDMAQYNRGLCYLMRGNYQLGFEDYDTRMRMGKTEDILRKRIGVRPQWDGRRCNHLLVYGEQGMGDLFMFGRLIELLAKRQLARRITFEVPSSMVGFMRHNFGDVCEVVPQTDTVTPSDEHVLLISLMKILNVTKETLPPAHLTAQPDMIKKWDYIARLQGYKVGVCWAGRSEAEQDMQVKEWNGRRSVPLVKLMPALLGIDGIRIVSLQCGVDALMPDTFPSVSKPLINSWDDTAAIMHHLDLIVSIDSGPVHLAGCLQRPTILLNHVHTCWRWGLVGSKSPWYDTVMVLRQEIEGDWDKPISEMVNLIANVAGEKRRDP
jgi:tetratricopeptide (TPR) repeat protein